MKTGHITHDFYWHEFQQPARHGWDRPEPVPDKYRKNVIRLCETVLQPLRDHLNVPIRVLSGYRSPEYNKKVGGVSRSTHLKGMAADIRAKHYTSVELVDIILKLRRSKQITGLGGMGLYSAFVHVDIRHNGKKRLARWRGFGMRGKI